MKIVQITNFKVSGVWEPYSLPPEFEGLIGTLYQDITDHPLKDQITIGWRYEGGDFLPPIEVIQGFGRIITTLAYRKRFTQSERVAIQLASYGNAPINASLAVNLADLQAARYVHLDRQDSYDSTHALELAGLIGVGRADVILSDPVYSNELLTETRLHYGLSPIPSEAEMLVNGGRGYASLNDYLANETL
jgi:hypothetical protein